MKMKVSIVYYFKSKKYIECICFYKLKEGATEPELLYTNQLENTDQV